MTPAMKKALGKWWSADVAAAPHVLGVRNDVARKLYERGYLEPVAGDKFRAGYASLKLTEKGREAVTRPLSDQPAR